MRNPPAQLTPGENNQFHNSIKVNQLKASCLEKTLRPPENLNKKASTEEDSSALFVMSNKGFQGSMPIDSDQVEKSRKKITLSGRDDDFRFDIDAVNIN